MKVLITGINGFVGSNLAHTLHSHDIYGMTTGFSNVNKDIEIFTWNELDKIPHVEVVIHLAGKAHDTKNRTAAQEYFKINVGLTQIIFDWFLKSNAKKFIFFSSVKAVADDTDGILTEDMTPAPIGPYGESKLRAEEYIKKYWDYAVTQLEKQIYILRPCMIHGHGNKGNLNLLYNIVRKGIPWPLGDFDNQRSFISIDNVSYIIKQLVEQNISSGIYNLADDEPISTNKIVQIICEAMSYKCKIWHINKSLIIGVAFLGTIVHLPLNRERLKKLTQNFVVSNEELKKALSIDLLPLSVKEGFIRTFHSL